MIPSSKQFLFFGILALPYLFIPVRLEAQIYPVVSQVSVAPPAPFSLEGFYAEGGTKVNLQIQVNDLTLENYPVKLRMVLEGNGIILTTGSWWPQQPFYLNAGEPLLLDGNELSGWFDPSHIQFSGLSREQYERYHQLPEGMYQLRFEVLDYYREMPVSSSGSALLYISLCDPPLLNLPSTGTEIPIQNIFLPFSWTSRHPAALYPGFEPAYELELWEIWPDDRSPEEIAVSQEPSFKIRTEITSVFLDLTELGLIPGRRYAWRIRVFDPDEKAAFRNDGFSAIAWFRYGKKCVAIEPEENGITASAINIRWEGDAAQEKFELRYREEKGDNNRWYYITTKEEQALVSPLKQKTSYEFQLQAYCDDTPTDYSEPLIVQTGKSEDPVCGGQVESIQVHNTTPLMQLFPGDRIQAADFAVEVAEVTGSRGFFSGRGLLLVPWLNSVKLEVQFENIGINDEYRLFKGSIQTVYNLTNGMVIEDLNSFNPFYDEHQMLDDPFTGLVDETIIADSLVKEVILKEDGSLEYFSEDDQPAGQENPKDKIIEVVSPDGQTFIIDREQKKVFAGSSLPPEIPVNLPGDGESTAYQVNFMQAENSSGGMDIPSENDPVENYEQIGDGHEPKKTPWKSMEAGKMEILHARVQGSPPDSIRFLRSSENIVLASEPKNISDREVLVTGLGSGEAEKLKAFYPSLGRGKDSLNHKEYIQAGQVNLVSYEKQYMRIGLVPVNGSACPDPETVEKMLNVIYAPAFVEFSVDRLDNFLVSLSNGQTRELKNTDPDDRMNYTEEMKQVIALFKENDTYDRSDYYFFFLDGSQDKTIGGYMPFKKQFGFIFKNNQGEDSWERTIAHELGHGAFRLRHTYSEENEFQQVEGSTDNLMDSWERGKNESKMSGSGSSNPPGNTFAIEDGSIQASAFPKTRLYKYQWDQVQDPEMRLNWWEDEEEGESKAMLDLAKLLKEIRNSNLDKNSVFDFSSYFQSNLTKSVIYSQRNVRLNEKEIEIACGLHIFSETKLNKLVPDNFDKSETKFQGLAKNSNKRLDVRLEFPFENLNAVLAKGNYNRPKVALDLYVSSENYEELTTYLLGKDEAIMRVNLALKEMEKLLGTEYAKQSGSLRTDTTKEALEKMDCSEFASRFIREVCGLEKVPLMQTGSMLTSIEDNRFGDFLQYLDNSDTKEFIDIKPGDVFLWSRSPSDGHTGVVVEFDTNSDMVTIIESIGFSGACEESLSKELPNYCKGCVRYSKYSRLGKSLYLHDGWKGYFRPQNN